MIGKRRWLFLVVPLGAAALVGAAVSYQNRSLLQHATRIGRGKAVTYAWRSPRTAVGVSIVSGRTYGQDTLASLTLTVIESGSGVEKPTDPPSLHVQELPDPSTAVVSPNGQWLLYATLFAEDRYGQTTAGFRAARIDGSGAFEWRAWDLYDRESQRRPVWLPDSSRWLELLPSRPGKTFLHTLDADGPMRIKVEGAPLCSALIGVTPDYRLIAVSGAANQGLNTSTVELVDFGIHPNTEPTRTIRLKAPPGGTISELALSPRGDRLAWLIGIKHYPPGYRLLSRWWPALAKRFHASEGTELRISHLDGTHNAAVAFQASDPRKLGHDAIWGVQWRPDGKAVSFVSASQLYQVPID